jgi:hypothetical protein
MSQTPELKHIRSLDAYDFIDMGASYGNSLEAFQRRSGGTGIGVDNDEAKVGHPIPRISAAVTGAGGRRVCMRSPKTAGNRIDIINNHDVGVDPLCCRVLLE